MSGCDKDSSPRVSLEASLILVEQEILDAQTPKVKAGSLQVQVDKKSKSGAGQKEEIGGGGEKKE